MSEREKLASYIAGICSHHFGGKVDLTAQDRDLIVSALRASPSAEGEERELIARAVYDASGGILSTDNGEKIDWSHLDREQSVNQARAIIWSYKIADAALSARPATEAQTKTEVFRDALERIALLDEADGHELTVTHAFNAVAIACTALGNKHPSAIFAERDARVALSAAHQSGGG